MSLPTKDRDKSCARALGLIESLLESGRAREALERAGPLFADELIPVSRIADLCRLTARIAQTLDLASLAETLWREAATRGMTARSRADDHVNLGTLLAGLGRPQEAMQCCRSALELEPHHGLALSNLAVMLADSGRPDEAEALHRQALLVDPTNAVTHTNLGVLLAATQRLDEAERCHRRALELNPMVAAAHTNLALLLERLERLEEAERLQRRALELAPHSAAIHSNLGNLLARRGDPVQAEHHLRRAIALDDNWPAAHCNLAVLLADERRDEESETHFRHALKLRSGYALARLGLGCLLLAQGRFGEGWQLHEARYDPALPDNGIAPPRMTIAQWRGESLTGKSILIWPEQGLGDQIQFCRYAPRLKTLGASRITLVCQKPLAELFRTLPGVERVIGAEVIDNAFHVDEAELGEHDFWTFVLSPALRVRTDLTTLPEARIPYLSADPKRSAAWAHLRSSTPCEGAREVKVSVGLVWRGNPRHNNDAERSLGGLQTLEPLLGVRGARFVSLQVGSAASQAGRMPSGMLQVGLDLRDFADTAAVLESLDLLICVDTSIAHLAGAMGKACWVLLPHRKTDWRWLRERDDSPWYPVGMRLFRQARRGDWPEVIERVHQALVRRVAESP